MSGQTERRFKVAHVSTSSTGGAAIAALRLHRGLLRNEVDSKFYSYSPSNLEQQQFTITKQSQPLRTSARLVFKNHLTKLPRTLGGELDLRQRPRCEKLSDCRTSVKNDLFEQVGDADVVHLHWVNRIVDLPGFFKRFYADLSKRKSIVWTLHDMNPMTGGCHYNQGCGRFRTHCQSCPQLVGSRINDASSVVFSDRKQTLADVSQQELAVVTPSRWLGDEVKSSTLLNRFFRKVIPYGIDTGMYYPVEWQSARASLGLDQELPTLAFISDRLSNFRKGYDLLVDALQMISDDYNQIQIITVGRGEVPALDSSNLSHTHIGHATNENLMRVVYSAADLFAIPSREDNLPNTVLESMACGTPVVGIAVGGIPDMVRPGETGWLAAEATCQSLAKTLRSALVDVADQNTAQRLQDNCIRVIKSEYTLQLQASRYTELYQSLIKEASVSK